MSKTIYVNLPVKDVAAARAFYAKMDFGVNEAFSNDQNALMVIDERIILMLVETEFFKQNLEREIADTGKVREVGLAIGVDSREEVDKLVEAALAAGAKPEGEVMDDKVMYSRGFSDLDGHRFDVLCMFV